MGLDGLLARFRILADIGHFVFADLLPLGVVGHIAGFRIHRLFPAGEAVAFFFGIHRLCGILLPILHGMGLDGLLARFRILADIGHLMFADLLPLGFVGHIAGFRIHFLFPAGEAVAVCLRILGLIRFLLAFLHGSGLHRFFSRDRILADISHLMFPDLLPLGFVGHISGLRIHRLFPAGEAVAVLFRIHRLGRFLLPILHGNGGFRNHLARFRILIHIGHLMLPDLLPLGFVGHVAGFRIHRLLPAGETIAVRLRILGLIRFLLAFLHGSGLHRFFSRDRILADVGHIMFADLLPGGGVGHIPGFRIRDPVPAGELVALPGRICRLARLIRALLDGLFQHRLLGGIFVLRIRVLHLNGLRLHLGIGDDDGHSPVGLIPDAVCLARGIAFHRLLFHRVGDLLAAFHGGQIRPADRQGIAFGIRLDGLILAFHLHRPVAFHHLHQVQHHILPAAGIGIIFRPGLGDNQAHRLRGRIGINEGHQAVRRGLAAGIRAALAQHFRHRVLNLLISPYRRFFRSGIHPFKLRQLRKACFPAAGFRQVNTAHFLTVRQQFHRQVGGTDAVRIVTVFPDLLHGNAYGIRPVHIHHFELAGGRGLHHGAVTRGQRHFLHGVIHRLAFPFRYQIRPGVGPVLLGRHRYRRHRIQGIHAAFQLEDDFLRPLAIRIVQVVPVLGDFDGSDRLRIAVGDGEACLRIAAKLGGIAGHGFFRYRPGQFLAFMVDRQVLPLGRSFGGILLNGDGHRFVNHPAIRIQAVEMQNHIRPQFFADGFRFALPDLGSAHAGGGRLMGIGDGEARLRIAADNRDFVIRYLLLLHRVVDQSAALIHRRQIPDTFRPVVGIAEDQNRQWLALLILGRDIARQQRHFHERRPLAILVIGVIPLLHHMDGDEFGHPLGGVNHIAGGRIHFLLPAAEVVAGAGRIIRLLKVVILVRQLFLRNRLLPFRLGRIHIFHRMSLNLFPGGRVGHIAGGRIHYLVPAGEAIAVPDRIRRLAGLIFALLHYADLILVILAFGILAFRRRIGHRVGIHRRILHRQGSAGRIKAVGRQLIEHTDEPLPDSHIVLLDLLNLVQLAVGLNGPGIPVSQFVILRSLGFHQTVGANLVQGEAHLAVRTGGLLALAAVRSG